MSSSALTFGGGTGDDLTWTPAASLHANGVTSLIMGWWKPTTLTATRKLWSSGSPGIYGAEIDATTSELRLKTDNNSTDGQWTTSGAGLSTDQWRFLAFMVSCNNTGPAGAWRVWSGTISSSPVECTVTSATSPAGNFVASAVDIYVGNAGTGTLAFQGDIAAVVTIRGGVSQFSQAAAGAITNDEADLAYKRHVLPYWSGKVDTFDRLSIGTDVNQAVAFSPSFAIGAYNTSVNTVFAPRTTTLNGATLSQDRCPRPYLGTVTRKELPASYL